MRPTILKNEIGLSKKILMSLKIIFLSNMNYVIVFHVFFILRKLRTNSKVQMKRMKWVL